MQRTRTRLRRSYNSWSSAVRANPGIRAKSWRYGFCAPVGCRPTRSRAVCTTSVAGASSRRCCRANPSATAQAAGSWVTSLCARLQYLERAYRDPFVHALAADGSPVHQRPLASRVRTTAVIACSAGNPPSGSAFPAQQFERLIAVGVVQMPGLAEDLEAKQDVVVPIAGIVQLQKRGRDHPPAMAAAEQSVSQKDLAGAFGRELAAFISSHLGMQGQGTERNETLGERRGAPARPPAGHSSSRRPATGYRVAAGSMPRCVHRRCQGTALTKPRCRRWRRAMLAATMGLFLSAFPPQVGTGEQSQMDGGAGDLRPQR
jgi:hypothetical protein